MTRLALLLLCLPALAWAGVKERQSFHLDQPGRVIYGTAAAAIHKDLPAGWHQCTNEVMGADPAVGIGKTCVLPTPEDAQFRVTAATPIWYGSGSRFTTQFLQPGTHVCNNATFGDPAKGLRKQCWQTTHMDSLECYPAQLGGTGSRAAWGVSLSPVQAWAGWWCEGRVQIVACAGTGCVPESAKRVITAAAAGGIINVELLAHRQQDINSAELRAVWAPHWAEIEATKP